MTDLNNLKPYNNIHQWYYRGSLKSCNYSCNYCPFAKNKNCSKEELADDRKNLEFFVTSLLEKTGSDGTKCAVQIVPYGEALIHRYYWKALARLSNNNFIEAAGAQTNLSFDIDKMIEEYTRNGGLASKLRLWCTFHPQMVTADRFLSQCRKLSGYGILYCAGAVGNPRDTSQIQYLRQHLPDNVYLFINKMDGLKRRYTEDEIKNFMEIDDYFWLELKHHKADISKCTGSLFADAAGNIKRCNICKPAKGVSCIRKECSCYLSYCNQSLPELVFFNPYPSFRIPHYPEAVFFDIDGTLTGRNGITESTVLQLKKLARHSSIFVATSLPYSHAIKKLNSIKELLSGGVFAYGGICQIHTVQEDNSNASKKISKKIFPLDKKLQDSLPVFLKENTGRYGYKMYLYNIKNNKNNNNENNRSSGIYKITLSFRHCSKITGRDIDNYIKQTAFKLGLIENNADIADNKNNIYTNKAGFNIIIEDGYIQIVARGAGKKEGIAYICSEMGYKPEDIAVFGNSRSDIPMLMEYQFSVATGADSETNKAARYVL